MTAVTEPPPKNFDFKNRRYRRPRLTALLQGLVRCLIVIIEVFP
jgi:hypothetical protein